MLDAITHPGGLEKGLAATHLSLEELESRVLSSQTLGAFDRLEIYADMYFMRLVEILEGEYPTVRSVIGADVFDEQCRLFLSDHPSRSHRLTDLSLSFPAWLAERSEGTVRQGAFVADLARVERAMEVVFDGPQAEPVAPDAFAALPPESWGDAKLEVIPAHQQLILGHPVNEFITAVMEGRDEEIPAPADEPLHVLVWRQDWRAWRRDQHPAQHAILGTLASGASLGEAVQAAAANLPGVDPAWLIERLGEWFEQWTTDGLFCRISNSTVD
jgi:hypothetical protein